MFHSHVLVSCLALEGDTTEQRVHLTSKTYWLTGFFNFVIPQQSPFTSVGCFYIIWKFLPCNLIGSVITTFFLRPAIPIDFVSHNKLTPNYVNLWRIQCSFTMVVDEYLSGQDAKTLMMRLDLHVIL